MLENTLQKIIQPHGIKKIKIKSAYCTCFYKALSRIIIRGILENVIFVETLINSVEVELDLNTIRFFQGDRETIETIYRTEYKLCSAFVLRNRGTLEDAKDCFQEAITATYHRGREPCLLMGVPLKSYLFGAIRNLWYKSLRDRKETIELNLEKYEEVLLQQYFPFEEEDRKRLVEKALSKLGEGCRDLITGFYIYGAQLKLIAEEQGWSYDSVKNKRIKCLKQLRHKFHSELTLHQNLMVRKTEQHG